MDITLNKQQSKFVTSTADTVHWVGNCAEGKSLAAKVKMVKFLQDNPETCGLVYYPTYRNLQEQMFDLKDSFAKMFGLRTLAGDYKLALTNGSTILAVPLSGIDWVRGIDAQMVLVDNFGAVQYEAFKYSVRLPRPKLGVKTQTIICTTDKNETNPRIVETSSIYSTRLIN